MGALDRFKNKAEELREKTKPLAGSLKDKAERATESLKAKANEFGDGLPHHPAGNETPTTDDSAAPESGPVEPDA
jgi:hypothetical protein